MTWCHHYQITVRARHIPGCLNVMADQVQSTEWSLHPQVFKQIYQKWFTPRVDLFPTRLNHKVPLYVSPYIYISTSWPGIPWFLDLVQLSTETPLQLPVSTTLLKQRHNQVFHNNLQYFNLHTWCLGVDSSKNKASLWKWQRELLPLKGHQQGPSASQSGPYLRNGENSVDFSTPSV